MNNTFKILLPDNNKSLNIPFEVKWDFYGRDDSIDVFEREVIEEVIGSPIDFEVVRFSHEKYNYPNNTTNYQTKLQYKFYFFSGDPITVTSSTQSNWVNSYIDTTSGYEGFDPKQLYYYEKPFVRSFFKLDFYDTRETSTQTNYFTIILPVQQGLTELVSISPYTPNVNVKKPLMNLDFVGDKEGFFIYWLRKRDFLNVDTFYMTAKFFDARIGEFVRLMNVPQSSLPSDKFIFDNTIYFYYKVVLDYNNKTYRLFKSYDENNLLRIGTGTPIEWYEYVNPQ